MKFEKQESEYVNGKSLKGMDGVAFEILSEVKQEPSDFGIKPRCNVSVIIGGSTANKKWTLNQQNLNWLIENHGEDSLSWIGKKVGVFTEEVKGNTAIRIRSVA